QQVTAEKLGMRFAAKTFRIAIIPEFHRFNALSREGCGRRLFVRYQQGKEQGANTRSKFLFQQSDLSTQTIVQNCEIPPASLLDPLVLKTRQQRVTYRRHAHVYRRDIEAGISHSDALNSRCREYATHYSFQAKQDSAENF